MRILIDFSQIPIQKTGVGTYAVNLIQQLSSLHTGDRDIFFILLQDDERVFDTLTNNRFVFIPVKSRIFRKFLPRFCLEQILIPWLIYKHQIDVLHSLHYSFPIAVFSAKKVVTIHDMTFFLFPEHHLPLKRYYFRFWITMAALFADHLVTVSESTRNDLYSYHRQVRSRVTVIPHSCEPEVLPANHEEIIQRVRQKYSMPQDYLLFVGTIEPRKNLCRLISAFERLALEIPDCSLVIVGQKGWGNEDLELAFQKSTARDRIIFTGFIPEMEKYLLLRHARLFVYPSIYEGFGLPVLEALRFGIPTVTSDTSSLPEVAGDAALTVDPFSVEAIYNAMKTILTDEQLYACLQRKAIRRSRLFSWEQTAEKTLRVYHSYRLQ